MGLTLGLGLKRIKYAHLLCCAGSSHGRNQHHEADPVVPNAAVNSDQRVRWKRFAFPFKRRPATVYRHFPSTTTRNIVSSVPSVTMNSRQRQIGIRFVHFVVFQSGTDAVHQHHEATHRSIECPQCDREFETQNAMDQVHAQLLSAQQSLADSYVAL